VRFSGSGDHLDNVTSSAFFPRRRYYCHVERTNFEEPLYETSEHLSCDVINVGFKHLDVIEQQIS